ncbi:MAG: hydrogenase [Spirochaetae bacterium HGW-Spirochaetae-7]|nr:MAG: hydrogenase [Spirochaetae bacterium HGW-Spirochaetae-7]
MFKEILVRMKQGHRTIRFPRAAPPALPDRFRGRPRIDVEKCGASCHACADACPVAAIDSGTRTIDLGKCLFCTDCSDACPEGAISFDKDYRLAASHRSDLLVGVDQRETVLAAELDRRMKRLFGRSLKLRQVSAGGCNACEADVNVLGTIGWDLGRFGIQFVASPRHADGLLVTGPLTRNMELALKKTWDAVPDPKIVIAVGACAIAGGPYAGHEQVRSGIESILPVDLYIPGCPPHPLTTLDGLLRLLGRLERGKERKSVSAGT